MFQLNDGMEIHAIKKTRRESSKVKQGIEYTIPGNNCICACATSIFYWNNETEAQIVFQNKIDKFNKIGISYMWNANVENALAVLSYEEKCALFLLLNNNIRYMIWFQMIFLFYM